MPRAATAAAQRPARSSSAARKPRAAAAAPKRAPRQAPQPKRVLRVVPRGGARPAALGSGLIDRLLRGRAWIAFIGVLLVGVVFLNVSLLEINRDITAKAERISELKRVNGEKRVEVAELASSERIQQAAGDLGFILPEPGKVTYLKATPSRDARRAADTVVAPIQQQQAAAQAPVTPQPQPVEPVEQTPPAAQQQQQPVQEQQPVQAAPTEQTTPPETGGTPGTG